VITSGPCLPDTCEIGDCCASIVKIEAGECGEDGVCVEFPVIVDCEPPYLGLVVEVDECYCAGCEISFKSFATTDICEGTDECCGDDCSGIAGWAISIYDYFDNPFDRCCDLTCADPIWSDSGIGCPVDTKTTCLTATDNVDFIGYNSPVGVNGRPKDVLIPDSGVYILLVELEDNVGNISKGLFAFGVGEYYVEDKDRVECFIVFGDIRFLEDCIDPEDKNSPWYKATIDKFCPGMDGEYYKEWILEVGDKCDLCNERKYID
ncbi:hypothetical protein KO361_05140, partial [Candidatus Woesearchaeota archaeon]|nr:hypothetical protein [Candidatus Woesearchaeota archaeon]